MTAPLVSIIVPTFNRADLVGETLDSIFAQSYSPIEIVVIDDGSADASVQTVRDWLDTHRSRFQSSHIIANGDNRGKSAVVNQGFDVAQGEYIMVFDSDDLLLPDALADEVAFLQEHSSVACVCAGALLLAGSEKTKTQIHSMRECPNSEDIKISYGDLLLKGNPVISSTVLMKRSVVKTIGYYHTRLRVSHDWDYWIRISQQYQFGFLNTPVMYYRVNSNGSISQNKFSLFKDVVKVIALHSYRYKRWEILMLTIRQIRDHLWMAKRDHQPLQFIHLLWYGMVKLSLIIFYRKK